VHIDPRKRKRPVRSGPLHTQQKVFSTMTSLQQGDVRGKAADTANERDFLLNVLRTAAARTRLATNAIETIGTALRHRQIDCQGAMAWAKDEGILDHLIFGPGPAGGQ